MQEKRLTLELLEHELAGLVGVSLDEAEGERHVAGGVRAARSHGDSDHGARLVVEADGARRRRSAVLGVRRVLGDLQRDLGSRLGGQCGGCAPLASRVLLHVDLREQSLEELLLLQLRFFSPRPRDTLSLTAV